jgi:hypothetical protein
MGRKIDANRLRCGGVMSRTRQVILALGPRIARVWYNRDRLTVAASVPFACLPTAKRRGIPPPKHIARGGRRVGRVRTFSKNLGSWDLGRPRVLPALHRHRRNLLGQFHLGRRSRGRIGRREGAHVFR